jgi:DNA-binding transcriptional regulator YhcF (GntR family)
VRQLVVRTAAEVEEPVYQQIARQLREAIAAGQLPAGRRLPAVRTLAADLGVNLNTVARAYRMLADEGFLAIRGRNGAAVAPPCARRGAPPTGLRDELRSVLARLRQAGLDAESLRRFAEREIAALGGEERGSRAAP